MFRIHFRKTAIVALASGSMLALQAPAGAAPIVFSGTATNQNLPAVPDASCAPLPVRVAFGPAGTSGQSNFGAFTYTQSHCTTGGPGAYGGGTFQYLFDNDMFSGSYSGVLSLGATPGLLNNSISFVIQQGTGRFLGATGTINGTGTLDVRLAMPRANLTLNGLINAPAVPEPTTWAMLILGFGLVGFGMRRRKVQTKLAYA